MTTYKRVEIGGDETPYGTRRYRIDEVEEDGETYYHYSFWLVRPRGNSSNRTYDTFFAGAVLSQEDFERMDAKTKEQLWSELLKLAGVKAKS